LLALFIIIVLTFGKSIPFSITVVESKISYFLFLKSIILFSSSIPENQE
jgi:hypothetical protein